MRKLRLILGLLVALAATSAPALPDVVILKDNDVPLTGTILPTPEDSTFIKFRIKGLGESVLLIEKSRIKRFWREANTSWEYARAEEKRSKELEEVQGEPEEKEARTKDPVVQADYVPPPDFMVPPRSRSGAEVRHDLVAKGRSRLQSLVPKNPILWVLGVTLIFVLITMILFLGSRVAELPRLSWPKAVFLAVVTQVFIALPVLAGPHVVVAGAIPLLLVCEAAAWVLFSRLLVGGAVGKSVMLLSFFLVSAFVIGGSFVSLLVAI